MKNLFVIFIALALITSCKSQPNHPISYWVDMTLQDLQIVHSQLEENTVAAINDSAFKNWLEDGYKEAQILAKKVNDFDGYIAVLKFYSARFYDTHIRVHPLLQSIDTNWAGFFVRYLGGKYFFIYVGDGITRLTNSPKVGDELTSIDGVVMCCNT